MQRLIFRLLRLLPSVEFTVISPALKPALAQLPTIYAVVDALVLRGYVSGQWDGSKAHRAIRMACESVSDGKLSTGEILELVEIVIAKYDPTIAAQAVAKAKPGSAISSGFLSQQANAIYSQIAAELFPLAKH